MTGFKEGPVWACATWARGLVDLTDLIDLGVSSTSATLESDVGSRSLIRGVVALALRGSGVLGGRGDGVRMGEGEGDRLRLGVFFADDGTPSRSGTGEDSNELGPAILDSVPLVTLNMLPFLFFKSFSFFFSLPLSFVLSFSAKIGSGTSFSVSNFINSC